MSKTLRYFVVETHDKLTGPQMLEVSRLNIPITIEASEGLNIGHSIGSSLLTKAVNMSSLSAFVRKAILTNHTTKPVFYRIVDVVWELLGNGDTIIYYILRLKS